MSATTAAPPAFPAVRAGLQADLLGAYPALIARMGWSREQIVEHQRARLRELLAHAIERSPFHGRRLAGLDPGSVDPRDLSRLPVMTKADMMADLDGMFTDRRLSRCAVEGALAAAGPEPAVLPGGRLAFASGGSSGERGVFVFDRAAALQLVGSLTRSLMARLQSLGGPPPGGVPMAIVAAASAVHLTGAAPVLTAGGSMPFRYVPVPVTRPLPEIVARLDAMQPPMLYGYPSMLARLAAEQAAGRLRIAPTVVTCTSETCTPELRAAIRAGFGAPVVDSFASTEGLVGASLPDEDVVVLAEDGCVVELVDERNRPVPPGTASAKVLVTNLANRTQPLIRYELGDSFVAEPASAGHGYLRVRPHGRTDETFRYGDVAVHPLVVRSVLVRAAEVVEYQVHQTATGIDVVVVTGAAADLGGLRDALAAALAGAGLARPEVVVRSATALPRHPETGKLRRFVPLA